MPLRKTFHESLSHRLLHRDIRDREAFERYAEAMRRGLTAEAETLMDHAVRVLRAFHQTRRTLYTPLRPPTRRTARSWPCNGKNQRGPCGSSCLEVFFGAYPLDRMGHVVRYLRAMEIRAERGANDPDRDRRKELEAAVFVDALGRMEVTTASGLTSEKREAD